MSVRQDCSSGLDNAWAETIDNHVADIVTNSWGDGVDDVADLGQEYIDFYQKFSLEAALTGITVNFSTGDAGDETKGGTDPAARTVSFPSDLPYVTGVGGTSLQVGAAGQWVGEYGWQNVVLDADQRRVGADASRDVFIRRRGRDELPVRATVLPEGQGRRLHCRS